MLIKRVINARVEEVFNACLRGNIEDLKGIGPKDRKV